MVNLETLANNPMFNLNEFIDSIDSIINYVQDAIFIFDKQKNCLFFNPAAEKLIGSNLVTFLTQHLFTSFNPCLEEQLVYEQALSLTVKNLPNIISEKLDQKNNKELELFCLQPKSSKKIWYKITSHPIATHNDLFQGSIIICRDITKDKQIENNIISPVFKDPLTNLPNKFYLLEQIKKAIILNQEKSDYICAVLLLDIDRLKTINNSFGRNSGDQILVEMSKRIQSCLRTEDCVARIGDDEFAILLNNIRKVSFATDITERIYQKLLLPFQIQGYEVFASIKIGIAITDTQYEQPEKLLQDAELAMSYAKRYNQACYQIFNSSMQARETSFLRLENDLRHAIDKQEFQLHYQPIISLQNQRIVGFEALVRWQHPQQGLISPVNFIPIAEQTGLIVPLGMLVLNAACEQMSQWQQEFAHAHTWKMSINVSSKQLTTYNFVEKIEQILQKNNLSGTNLKLEITETSLIDNTEYVLSVITQLQKIGVEFSLDDFGTGYSSLGYLHKFPFQTLKIDRSFIQNIQLGKENLSIVRAIISMAQSLNMNVIAEGIETNEQLAHLKALKCQYGQGYLFSKPLSKRALKTFINAELIDLNQYNSFDNQAHLEQQLSYDKLLYDLENLQQQLNAITQEKADLEIMLETATEHADLVESELQKEISNRRKIEADLQQANQKLERLTFIDGLTGVANRRKFDHYLEQQWQHLRAEEESIALILCDVDYFKRYNDTYGHQCGDRCLQQIALTLKHTTSYNQNLVARYGGEEFAIILPYTDAEQAMMVAENIRQKVKDLRIAHQSSLIDECVTVSIGVFSMKPNDDMSPDLLVAFADKALYHSKENGRNCATFAPI